VHETRTDDATPRSRIRLHRQIKTSHRWVHIPHRMAPRSERSFVPIFNPGRSQLNYDANLRVIETNRLEPNRQPIGAATGIAQ
jgi:hypothetical protein